MMPLYGHSSGPELMLLKSLCLFHVFARYVRIVCVFHASHLYVITETGN